MSPGCTGECEAGGRDFRVVFGSFSGCWVPGCVASRWFLVLWRRRMVVLGGPGGASRQETRDVPFLLPWRSTRSQIEQWPRQSLPEVERRATRRLTPNPTLPHHNPQLPHHETRLNLPSRLPPKHPQEKTRRAIKTRDPSPHLEPHPDSETRHVHPRRSSHERRATMPRSPLGTETGSEGPETA